MKRITTGLVTVLLTLPLMGVAAAASAEPKPSADLIQTRYSACMDRLGDAPRSADVLQGWIIGCRAEALR